MAYTCITCRVVFHEPEIQRAHYKTDWHRYNLKRKMAELPTVTADDFREKVLAQQSLAAETENKGTRVCLQCKKQFATENSYNCHVRSKRHLEKVASSEAQGAVQLSPNEQAASNSPPVCEPEAETPIVVEEECEPEPLEINECLFCSKKSDDMESSLIHMSKAHGFFIPDLDYIADIKGLISYLCEKVGVGCMCLYCNDRGKAFHSVEAVQQHMVTKSHCKIFFEDDAAFEYAEYYDYSSSYPEGHEEGAECQTLAVASDNSAYVNDDLALVLPSGVAVGHRALRYLYKQRLPTLEHRKAAMVSRLLAQYRALGSREHCVGEAVKRVRDQRWFGKMCQERDMKLGVRANKLQKHFRPQMMV